MLKFFKTSSADEVARLLTESILRQLGAGKPVVWLISGGSAINVAVIAAKLLSGNNLTNLSVSLIDERYGAPGHADSNWQQLLASGFSLNGAKLVPVLNGADFNTTTEDFNNFIMANSQAYKIGLLGMGTDGHTAGLLPGCPILDSSELAASYQGPDYQRISLTPKGLVLLDEALVFAQGRAKEQALDDLSKNLSISKQPAQIIKQIPNAAVYNDLIGEKI